MNIVESQRDGIVVLALSGHLNAQTSEKLDDAIQGAVAAGNNRLVLDLADVAYVSSAGLRVFLIGARKVQPDGKLVIVNAAPAVLKVLSMTNFDKIAPVASSIDDAISICS